MPSHRLPAGWLTDKIIEVFRFLAISVAVIIAIPTFLILWYYFGDGIFPYYVRPTGEVAFVLYSPFARVREFHDGLAAVTAPTFPKGKVKSGFVNLEGKFVVPLEYDWVSDFNNGQSIVERGSTKFCIDSSGAIIYEVPQDFNIENFLSSPNLRNVRRKSDRLVGAVDDTGKKVVIPFMFAKLWQLSDKCIVFQDPHTLKWGCMDKQGKIICAPKFDEVDGSSWGLAAVALKENNRVRWGLIDDSGAYIFRPKFLSLKVISPDLCAATTLNDQPRISIVTRQGSVLRVLDRRIRSISEFHAGLAKVREGGGDYGYVDTNFEMKIQPQFWSSGDFEDSAC